MEKESTNNEELPSVQSQEKKVTSRFGLTEAAFLAVLTLGGYAVAFSYEAAFCGHFHIPLHLISISMSWLLACTAAILAVTTPGILIVILLLPSVPVPWRGLMRHSGAFVLVAAYVAFMVLQFDLGIEAELFLIGFVAFIGLLHFGLPLLTQRKVRGYAQKLEAQKKLDAEGENLLDIFVKKMPDSVLGLSLLIFLIMVACTISSAAGTSAARSQEIFMTTNQFDKEFAVLRIFDGKFICAPVDKEKRQVEPTFVVIDPSNCPEPPQFKYEKLGILEPKWFPDSDEQPPEPSQQNVNNDGVGK